MWKQIKTYTAAWTGRTFSVDFYQNLDLHPGPPEQAGELWWSNPSCTSGAHHHHHHHHCWTAEPANETVKLSTSAGSLCRGDTTTLLPDLPVGLIRDMIGPGWGVTLEGLWCEILSWCHTGQDHVCSVLISTLCFRSPSCLQPAAMIPARLFSLLCVCVSSQCWALDTGQ